MTLTIQKSDPVAKSAYCSMVDRTLNIRQTRTMRNLHEEHTGASLSLIWPHHYLFPSKQHQSLVRTSAGNTGIMTLTNHLNSLSSYGSIRQLRENAIYSTLCHCLYTHITKCIALIFSIHFKFTHSNTRLHSLQLEK